MHPRTKADGGGPGLKGIKKDQPLGPAAYNVNMKLVEKKSTGFKFSNVSKKTQIAKQVEAKAYVPGAGKYADNLDRGFKL